MFVVRRVCAVLPRSKEVAIVPGFGLAVACLAKVVDLFTSTSALGRSAKPIRTARADGILCPLASGSLTDDLELALGAVADFAAPETSGSLSAASAARRLVGFRRVAVELAATAFLYSLVATAGDWPAWVGGDGVERPFTEVTPTGAATRAGHSTSCPSSNPYDRCSAASTSCSTTPNGRAGPGRRVQTCATGTSELL